MDFITLIAGIAVGFLGQAVLDRFIYVKRSHDLEVAGDARATIARLESDLRAQKETADKLLAAEARIRALEADTNGSSDWDVKFRQLEAELASKSEFEAKYYAAAKELEAARAHSSSVNSELANLQAAQLELLKQELNEKTAEIDAMKAALAAERSASVAATPKHVVDAFSPESVVPKPAASIEVVETPIIDVFESPQGEPTPSEPVVAMEPEPVKLQLETVEPAAKPAPGRKDAFEKIEGIGPVFEKKLWDAGIHTFQQLAQLTPDEVTAIIKPQEWQRIDPERWIQEAYELARAERISS